MRAREPAPRCTVAVHYFAADGALLASCSTDATNAPRVRADFIAAKLTAEGLTGWAYHRETGSIIRAAELSAGDEGWVLCARTVRVTERA